MSKPKPPIAGQTPLSAVPEVDTHGDEKMTPEQAATLRALADEAGEPFDAALTRAQAQERIDELKSRR